MLADGKTLLAMPTIWSAAVIHASALVGRRRCHLAAGEHCTAPTRITTSERTTASSGSTRSRPTRVDARTAWFCQGNLYVTHDAGRSWAVASPRFKRPWHCAALAIAPGKAHTLLLLVQSKGSNPRRVPGKLLRSADGGATWHKVKAPRSPQLAYNGHALAFDPVRPSTALMIGARGKALGALYRTVDAGLHWKRVQPGGKLPGAVVDQFAFAADGRVLALLHIG